MTDFSLDMLVETLPSKVTQKNYLSVGECKIKTISNPFESLVEAIITQQISDSAGKFISKKFIWKKIVIVLLLTANTINCNTCIHCHSW
jgi:3-methyladenine DNA glycosylase/8-oxoguanine DNA glycosylase